MAKRKFGATSGPPDPILLALISQFLSNHGFSSSLRIFNTERRKRPRKDGFQDTYGEKCTKEIPQLDEIFRMHMQNHPLKSANITNGMKASSNEESIHEDSDSEDSSAFSSASDASSSKSDVDMIDIPKPQQNVETDDTSSDSSDSESDDEDSDNSKEPSSVDAQAPASRISSLKRRASSSSESSENSSDESSSSEDEGPATKKVKIEVPKGKTSLKPSASDSELEAAVKTKLPPSDSDGSSTSSSSDTSGDSDSSSESEEESPPSKKVVPPPKLAEVASDSSATVTGETIARSFSTKEVGTPKKHVGARPTRLAELSANANTKEYVSNNYVSYAYADRAYNDLSITRGKGFTKEKNKKKRGSYRGGTIDTSGGKGFQFED